MNQQNPNYAGIGGSRKSNEHDDDEEEDDAVTVLLHQLYEIAAQGGYDAREAVCEIKASNVLEATAGNIPLAAQLYWDDFLASVASNQHQLPPPYPPPPVAPAAAAALLPLNAAAANQKEDTSKRLLEKKNNISGAVLRRRLEQSFNRHFNNNEEEGPSKHSSSKKRRLQNRSLSRNDSNHSRSRKQARSKSNGRRSSSSSSSSDDDDEFEAELDEAKNNEAPQPLLRGQDMQGGMVAAGGGAINENNNNANNDNEILVAAAVAFADGGFNDNNNNNDLADVRAAAVEAVSAESVSISDDEAAMFAAAAGWTSKFGGGKFKKRGTKSNNKSNNKSRRRNHPKKNDLSASFRIPLAKKLLQQQLSKGVSKQNDDDEDSDSNSNDAIDNELVNYYLNADDDDIEGDDGYLSENDWIWDALAGREPSSATVAPLNILWGGIPNLLPYPTNEQRSVPDDDEVNEDLLVLKHTSAAVVDGDTMKDENSNAKLTGKEEYTNKGNYLMKKKTKKRSNPDSNYEKSNAKNNKEEGDSNVADESNMIASDDDNINPNVGDHSSNNKSSSNRNEVQSRTSEDDNVIVGIPYTWLNAGFQFSDDGFGLTLHPPCEEDVGYNEWKASELWRGNARNAIPPPYHCRAVTALLSIVNGLLYTGTCITPKDRMSTGSAFRPRSESCARQPLAEITQEQEELERQHKLKKQQKLQDKKLKGKKLEKQLNEDDILFHERKKLTKRELEARLTDALTSLLVVAIRASVTRKKKILELLRNSKDPVQQRNWQKLERKLRLCPVGWYDRDNISAYREQSYSNSNPLDNIVEIALSYTNIDDIKAYVSGNLSAFMSSGGCALFLETIIRIHGKGSVLRMIRKARRQAGITSLNTSNDSTEACASNRIDWPRSSKQHKHIKEPHQSAMLVFCTCEERHKQKLEANPMLGRSHSSANSKLDTTPTSHECISIELISLLLTGRVYSTFKGWSTGPLGVGLLSNKPGEVGKGLTRPEKPVWILRGPTAYSCLWLNGCTDHGKSFSKLDHPCSVAVLTHWNCWYGEQNKTKIRLVTNRNYQWQNELSANLGNFSADDLFDKAFNNENDYFVSQFYPSSAAGDGNRIASEKQLLMNIILQRRRAYSEWIESVLTGVETIDPKFVVSDEEMNKIKVHPDDQKFYPSKYHLWRYQLDSLSNDGGKKDMPSDFDVKNYDEEKKQELASWRAFHRLTDREQLVVEMKFGPKINTILRTRWPQATMDRFEPEHPQPTV